MVVAEGFVTEGDGKNNANSTRNANKERVHKFNSDRTNHTLTM